MKLYTLLLMIAPLLVGQQNIVQTTLVANSSTKGATTYSTVQNIGQNMHQVVLVYKDNAGTGSCSATGNISVIGNLQFSQDNLVWQNFGNFYSKTTGSDIVGVGATILTRAYTWQGSGVYSRVRFVTTANSWTGTNCIFSAYYAGSISLSNQVTVQGNAPPGSSTNNGSATNLIWNYNPTFTGGYGTGDTISPFYNCDTPFHASITAGNTTRIIAQDAYYRVVICSMVVTMATTGTFKIITGDSTAGGGSANCASSPQDLSATFNLIAGTPLSFPVGLSPVFITPGISDVCIIATTGNVSVSGSYMLSYH